MEVQLFNFNKKVNSTSRPSGGTAVDMSMRTGFADNAPQLEYRGNPFAYNYMYIPTTGKYYYITDAKFNAEENFFLMSGEVDVLATWRTQIHNSSQWVTRWSGSDDVSIMDDLDTCYSQPYVRPPQHVSSPFTLAGGFQDSCVVLTVAGSGRVCMTGRDYNLLMNSLTRKSDPFDFGTYFTQDVARLLNNPASYIVDAICIPIQAYGGSTGTPIMASGSSAFEMVLGWYRPVDGSGNSIRGFRVNQNVEHFEATIGIGAHPQAVSNEDYLNYPPYTDVKLYVSGIGIIAIDGNKLSGAENLRVQGTLDYVNGGITVRVKKEGSNTVIAYATGQIGYSLAVTQAHSADALGSAGSLVMGTITGGLMGGPFGAAMGAAGGAVGALGNLGNNSGITVHGANGGAGAWFDYNGQFISAMETFKRVRKPPAQLIGRPYARSATLGNLGGFVKCATGDVSCGANEEQKLKIRNYLQGGVYIE